MVDIAVHPFLDWIMPCKVEFRFGKIQIRLRWLSRETCKHNSSKQSVRGSREINQILFQTKSLFAQALVMDSQIGYKETEESLPFIKIHFQIALTSLALEHKHFGQWYSNRRCQPCNKIALCVNGPFYPRFYWIFLELITLKSYFLFFCTLGCSK